MRHRYSIVGDTVTPVKEFSTSMPMLVDLMFAMVLPVVPEYSIGKLPLMYADHGAATSFADHVFTPPSSNPVTLVLTSTTIFLSIVNCVVVSISLNALKSAVSSRFATVAAVPLHCLSR